MYFFITILILFTVHRSNLVVFYWFFFSIFESRIKYKYFKKVEKQEQTHVNLIAAHIDINRLSRLGLMCENRGERKYENIFENIDHKSFSKAKYTRDTWAPTPESANEIGQQSFYYFLLISEFSRLADARMNERKKDLKSKKTWNFLILVNKSVNVSFSSPNFQHFFLMFNRYSPIRSLQCCEFCEFSKFTFFLCVFH